MKCQDVHTILENPLGAALAVRADGKVAKHIAECAECRRWAEIQNEVGGGLKVLRHALPEFPASLDARILANFRQKAHVPAVSIAPVRLAKRFNPFTALAWSAALIAAIFLAKAEIGFIFPPEEGRWISRDTPGPAAAKAQPIENPAAKAKTEAKPQRRVERRHLAIPHRSPVVPVEQATSLQSGFTGLMYCDAISCGGGMEVIRVQLPSQDFPLMAGNAAADTVISADVLVGADGIARGIRIVQ